MNDQIIESDETSARMRKNLFRKIVSTEIVAKSWEIYTDSDGSERRNSFSSTQEDTDNISDSISMDNLSVNSSDSVVITKRKIKSFRTIAWIVRALISVLPKSFFTNEIIYEEIDGEKILKAGTLEAIIVSFTQFESTDVKHLKEFLLTYRYFSTPEEVIEGLIQRFRVKSDTEQLTPIRLKVVNIFRRWLKEHFYDFEQENLTTVENFIENDVAKAPESAISKLAETLLKIIRENSTNHEYVNSLGGKSQVTLNTAISLQSVQSFEDEEEKDLPAFAQINPVDIFRQLSLMEVTYFKQITPRDLFFKTAKRQHEKCPSLMKLIAHFNNVSFWVAKEICLCENLKQRIIILKRFIHIAQFCFEYKNFNTCLEIVGGLSMSCVQRLKKTWKGLASKYLVWWKELQRIMAPTQNYIVYRNFMKTVDKTAFPYFGIYLSDLTLIQEKYQTKIAGGLINFSKMRMLANVILDMQSFQSLASFPFGDNPIVNKYLEENTTNLLDEEELYAQSKVCEPSEKGKFGRSTRQKKPKERLDVSTITQ